MNDNDDNHDEKDSSERRRFVWEDDSKEVFHDEDDSSERESPSRLERFTAPDSRRGFLSSTAKIGGGAVALSAAGIGAGKGNGKKNGKNGRGPPNDPPCDRGKAGEHNPHCDVDAAGAVFVMTNDPEKNEVVAFSRADDGTLTEAGTFDTGGTGSNGFEDTDNGLILGSARGEAAPNNLIEDTDLLFATNPGSNSISVFEVDGADLDLVEVQDSMGEKPVSVTVNDGLLYVLNSGETEDGFESLPNCTTGNDPTITGFDVSDDGQLTPISGSTRPLSGDSESGCAQVSFTPDGEQLVATERLAKTDGQTDSDIELLDEEGVINVYDVNDDGTVSDPVVNAPTGQGPFGFTFTKQEDGGELLTTEQFDGPANPGQGAAASYVVNDDGTLTPRSGSVNNGGTDTCWIVATDDAKYAYTTSFFADGRISTYGVADDGQLSLLEGEEAFIGQGASDVSLSLDSRYFYARNSFDGTVTGFRVEDDGSLTELQTISDSPPSDTAARISLAAY